MKVCIIGGVALRCQAFGMKILYHKRTGDLSFEKAAGIPYAPLEALIRESDSISLHLPLTKEATNLIDAHDVVRVIRDELPENLVNPEVLPGRTP